MANNKKYRRVKVLRNRDKIQETYKRELEKTIAERDAAIKEGREWEPPYTKSKGPIRWRDKDREELRREVKRYNAKISRWEKKLTDPRERNALPPRLKMKDVLANITTRDDFNRELKSMRKWNDKRGVEFVILDDLQYKPLITNYQRLEMSYGVRTTNAKRVSRYVEAAFMPRTNLGEDLGYTAGDVGLLSNDAQSLRPINDFYPTMTKADIDMRLHHIKKENSDNYFNKRDEILKENMIKGIQNTYGEERTAEIVEAIENMPTRDFYKIWKSEGGTKEDEYGLNDAGIEENLNALRAKYNVDEYLENKRRKE